MLDALLNRLGRRAEEYGREASSRGRDWADRLGDRGEDARGELRRLYARMEDILDRRVAPAASDAADVAGRYASRYAGQGREVAEDVADRVSAATRAQPLVALGIAVAATLIISSLLSGRRR